MSEQLRNNDVILKTMKDRMKNFFRKNRKILLINAILLAYGLIVAFIIIWQRGYWESAASIKTYMGARLDLLNVALGAFRTGNFKDLLTIVDYQGTYYFYLAYIADLIGISPTAHEVYLAVQRSAAILLLAVYPTIFYRLTKSKYIAVLSPLLLNYFAGYRLFEVKSDSYWIYGWIIAIGIPLLWMLCKKEWKRAEWGVFAALCALMALGNLPRAEASLPIATVLVIIVVIRGFLVDRLSARNKRKKIMIKKLGVMLMTLAAIVISYQFFTLIIPSTLNLFPGMPKIAKGIGPWHTLYIGLGYVEDNPYGLYYDDTCAMDKVESIAPGTEHGGEVYSEILKKEYFKIVKENPAFVLETYVKKFGACFTILLLETYYRLKWIIVEVILLIVIGVSIGYVLRKNRREVLAVVKKQLVRYLMPFIFCILTGLVAIVPAIIAMPWADYLAGFIAACNMFAVLFSFLALEILLAGWKIKKIRYTVEDIKVMEFPTLNLPFEARHIFYRCGELSADNNQCASRHAKFCLINIRGTGKIKLVDYLGNEKIICLGEHTGVFLPKMIWQHLYDFSADSILLVISSEAVNAEGYIYDYSEFAKNDLQKKHN